MPDIPGDSSTTSTITVGGTVTNELELVGDHDWFKITLTAGQSITVTLNGLSSGTGLTLEDPYLYIRSATGDLLFEDDDIQDGINRDSSVSFTATTSGTYYIDVGAWNEGYKGTYKLSVSPYTPPPLWTNDQIANQLTSGFWGDGSHSFALTAARTISVNLTGLTPEGTTLARAALAAWTEIIGVTFPEVLTGGQIIFDDSAAGANTRSDYDVNTGAITASYVNIETKWLTDYGSTVGTYGYQTYLHEIGHALGLGHAGNYNGDARYPYEASFQNDSWAASVMSYFSQKENTYTRGQGFTEAYLVTPMVADIIAIQQLYGAGSARSGDTSYGVGGTGIYVTTNFSSGLNGKALTIYDTGGIDTIDFSTMAKGQKIDLNAETFSNVGTGTGNLSIARGTIIENATGGSGADTLIGNSVANVLRGNGGNDNLTGGAGNDTFIGTTVQMNGDTVTDFSTGDKLVFTDASSDSFTFSLSGSTLTFTGGSMTLTGVSGTLVASAAAGGGVQLSISAPHQFNSISFALQAFGSSSSGGSWTSYDAYPRQLGDVNADGNVDIVAFGNAGVYVALANGTGGFGPSNFVLSAFGAAGSGGGWSSENQFPRELGDVNGDGRADIVGFGNAGVYVALANGSGGFGAPNFVLQAFGTSAAAGGWSSDNAYPRLLGDVNGDGRSDIVAFGNAGVYVSLGQANGTFAAPTFTLAAFGASASAGGWSSNDAFPRHLADVNNDHHADIVGFGSAGTYIAYGNGDGTFDSSIFDSATFGSSTAAGGWSSENSFPRELADINHDGSADIVGFGSAGVYVALSHGDFFI